jgi:hypothetical protein
MLLIFDAEIIKIYPYRRTDVSNLYAKSFLYQKILRLFIIFIKKLYLYFQSGLKRSIVIIRSQMFELLLMFFI